MLAGKMIIEEANSEPDRYLCLEIEDTRKTVELEGDWMTLFVSFSRNQDSLWNMMCRQADEHFTFLNQTKPDSIGHSCVERTYATPADNRFGFILSNDFGEGEISVQITIPVSERALDQFIEWEASPAGCCKFLSEELQLAMGEKSQNEHYRPGALRGDFN